LNEAEGRGEKVSEERGQKRRGRGAPKLRHVHRKREEAREDNRHHRVQRRPQAPKELLLPENVPPPVENDAARRKGNAHYRRKPKQRRDRVAHPHVVLVEQYLSEGPPQTAECGGGENLDHADEVELGLSGDHEDDAGGDDQDDTGETPGGDFEVEEEGEEEDKGEGRGFAHGCSS
jgi:hypothetical protein